MHFAGQASAYGHLQPTVSFSLAFSGKKQTCCLFLFWIYIHVYVLVCLFQDINANTAIGHSWLLSPTQPLAILYYYWYLS